MESMLLILLEDQTEAALAHEAEKRLMQNTVSDSEKGGE